MFKILNFTAWHIPHTPYAICIKSMYGTAYRYSRIHIFKLIDQKAHRKVIVNIGTGDWSLSSRTFDTSRSVCHLPMTVCRLTTTGQLCTLFRCRSQRHCFVRQLFGFWCFSALTEVSGNTEWLFSVVLHRGCTRCFLGGCSGLSWCRTDNQIGFARTWQLLASIFYCDRCLVSQRRGREIYRLHRQI